MRSLTLPFRVVGRALLANGAESLFALSFVGGWLCLAAGLAALLGGIVWWFAAGVLLWSGCGWRLLYRLSRDGLYALSRRPPGEGGGR